MLWQRVPDPLAMRPATCEPTGREDWQALVQVLADEVRTHLVRRELDGRSVVLPGRRGRFAAVYLAREVLADVERCIGESVGEGAGVSIDRWRGLAERLQVVEGAVHAAG